MGEGAVWFGADVTERWLGVPEHPSIEVLVGMISTWHLGGMDAGAMSMSFL